MMFFLFFFFVPALLHVLCAALVIPWMPPLMCVLVPSKIGRCASACACYSMLCAQGPLMPPLLRR
jgi:hypothetical protein